MNPVLDWITTHWFGCVLLAFALVLGVALLFRRRRGTWSLPLRVGAGSLALLGLSGLFAVEFLTHAVLQYQDAATREQILTGPGRPYFLTVALTFLLGVLLFTAASWRAAVLSRPALTLYAVGLTAAALRTSVPEPVYLAGLAIGSAGVLWLAGKLLRQNEERATVRA